MGGRVIRSCRWSLYHSGKWSCRLPAVRSPGEDPPTPLDEGCPKDCDDKAIVPWKKDLYGEDYDDEATVDVMPMPPRVLEQDGET